MSIECAYGCGKPAIYFNNKNVGRCSKSPSTCEALKKRNSESVKHSKSLESVEYKLHQKKKRKQTMLERYGAENPSQVDSVKQKRIETYLKRFGVTNPSYDPEILEKIKSKTPVVLEKRKQTSLAKYGKESYASTDEFKRRRESTWLGKYGVDNPTKNPDILEKVMEGQDYRKTSKTILLNGQLIRVQGHEDQVIFDLIKSGISESEIICSRKDVPKIKYEINGKIRTYYPDIYIRRFNLLIEVKSLYTWQKYKDINLAKIAAAKAAGYCIRILVRNKPKSSHVG